MAMFNELNDIKDSLKPKEYKNEKRKRTIGLIVGPVLFLIILLLPCPASLNPTAWRCLAVTVWMLVWWVTEPFAIPTTSLLLILAYTLLKILPAESSYAALGSSVVFMLIGSFILVNSLSTSGLGKRIALIVITKPWVNSPWRIVMALSLVAILLSSVMPNIPVTILMLGIVTPILEKLEAPFRGVLTTLLLLSTAWPATIGGIITPIGATVPNFMIIGITKQTVGINISFIQWLAAALPIAIILTISMFLVFKLLYRMDKGTQVNITAMKSAMEEEHKSMGKMSRKEIYSLSATVLALVLWILPGLSMIILGKSSPITAVLEETLSMEKVALFVALLLLIVPVNWKERQYAVSWREAAASIDVGLILFVAAAFTIPTAFISSGLLGFITDTLSTVVQGMSPYLVILILAMIEGIATQIGLQMPMLSLLIPISATLIGAMGGNPAAGALAVGIMGVGGAFVVPIATPTNVIPYATGRMKLSDFVKGGSILLVIAWILMPVILYPLASFLIPQ